VRASFLSYGFSDQETLTDNNNLKKDESEAVKLRHNTMSETVSFLGGAAIAGLAALFLLRGGGLANSLPISSLTQPPSVGPIAVPTPAAAPAPVAPSPSPDRSDALKNELDGFKVQAERQKLEIDQLKYANQQLQGQVQLLATQAKAGAVVQGVDAAGNPLPAGARAIAPPQQDANPVFTGMMWATGGVVLCLTGGSMLVLMISALSRQQPRTAMRGQGLVYPIDAYPPRVTYRRRYALPPEEQLPIPMQRVRQVDYEQ
jgi:hypothetical protein